MSMYYEVDDVDDGDDVAACADRCRRVVDDVGVVDVDMSMLMVLYVAWCACGVLHAVWFVCPCV